MKKKTKFKVGDLVNLTCKLNNDDHYGIIIDIIYNVAEILWVVKPNGTFDSVTQRWNVEYLEIYNGKK